MLREQILEMTKCPWVTGVGLRGVDENTGCFPKLSLSKQGEPEVLVPIWPIRINLDSLAAISFSFRELAQRIQGKTQIIVDKVPGERLRRLWRSCLADRSPNARPSRLRPASARYGQRASVRISHGNVRFVAPS